MFNPRRNYDSLRNALATYYVIDYIGNIDD